MGGGVHGVLFFAIVIGGIITMLNEYSAILSVEDVMEILGIGKNAAYDLFRNGDIKCFRLKNRWKVPKQAVIDYINNQSNSAH